MGLGVLGDPSFTPHHDRDIASDAYFKFKGRAIMPNPKHGVSAHKL
jgi:hypothetical protein